MRSKWLILLAVAAAAAPAVAHHSFAMFDMAKDVTATGTVTEFRWTNPHAWLHLDVADAGGTTNNWAIEMTSPNNLIAGGWRRSSLKVGDKVSVRFHPLINGKKGGSLDKVTLVDGTVLQNK
jgi:hypothetical protein